MKLNCRVLVLVSAMWLFSCGDDSGPSTDDVLTDTYECQNWHYPGDGKYGDHCWDPPENLCKNGGGADAHSWYCSPDGKSCCITFHTGCFFCGWIECQARFPDEEISQECAQLNVPQKFIDCANGKDACLPEVKEQMLDPETCLAFPDWFSNPDYRYCWDEYVM